MNLIRLFIDRPVMTLMMVLVFVVLGLISYQRINVDLFPEIDLPIVLVTQVYEGAGPEEIETQIVREVEDAVSTISDIKHITSTIYEGYALTVIEFEYGVDADIKSIEVKDKVDAIARDLPQEADRPVIEKFDPFDEPTLSIALFSDTMPIHEIYRYADDVLKDRFSRVGGVASVEVVGGKERQINVRADLPRLLSSGVSLFALAGAIQERNLDIPAGAMDRGEFEIGVRLKGQFESVEEIADMHLAVEDRGVIRVRDVAEVEDGFEDPESAARFNGREAVMIEIFKQTDSNVVSTADGVYSVLESVKQALPPGLQAEISWDGTDFIRESIRDALTSIFIGVGLTALVLLLFLGDLRMAMVAALVIPTSLISSFLVMQFLGFTLNIVTLMALGVSIGALVANAIVIIENIYKHILEHEDPREGAVRGTREVLVAVLASAGTNIVVFVPIAFMAGIFGQVFYPFGITVVAATVFSIIASFSLTPTLSYFAMRRSKAQGAGGGAVRDKLMLFARGVERVRLGYLKLLDVCLNWRKLTVVFTLAVFAVSLFVMRYVGGEPFPTADSSEITINADLPLDATVEAGMQVMSRIEDMVKGLPETRDYSSTLGGRNRGVNQLRIHVRLVDARQRDRSDSQIAEALLEPLCTIPDLEFSITAGSSQGMEGDMDIELYGPDYGELVRLSGKVRQAMNDTGNFQSIISSYKTPRREMRFISHPYRSIVYGGNNSAIGGTLRAAVEGVDASIFREGGQEYDINVALDDRYTDSINLLGAILVPLGKNAELSPVNKVGSFVPGRAEASIQRKDKERKITLTGFISRLSLTENITLLQERFQDLDLGEGYRIEFAGDVEINREANEAVSGAFIIATILTFMLLAAILNSLVHPLTILLTVPLALAGVFYVLFFSGITMNMMAMMAIVMLVGIVVNGAILVIDGAMVANRLEECDPVSSVRKACAERFRPIVMSNIAIIFGLIPQAFGAGSGASFRMALALPTIGGIIVSTLFTMFFIPVIFTYMERLRTSRISRSTADS